MTESSADQTNTTNTRVSKDKKIHPLVRFNYLPRLVGFLMFGAILTSIFFESRNAFIWLAIVFTCLLWPHLAYFIGTRHGDPRKAELFNYLIEAINGGIWIVSVSFSPWPSAAIIFSGVLNSLVIGGFKLLLKNLLGFGISLTLTGFLLGFHFEPDASLPTVFFSFLFILIYVVLVSYSSFKSSQLLRESKKELRADLIQRQKVEKELLKANDELQRFAYVVSHDLKAPLRGMSSLVHFIEQDTEDIISDSTSNNISLLRKRLKRLEKLIDGILKYSRAEKNTDDIEVLDVNNIIREVINDLDIPSTYEIKIETEFPHIKFNEVRLTEIYSNLIDNAIKYNNKTNGVVSLGYEGKGQVHKFTVCDNGVGISVKHHDRVFEMFKRLHSGDKIEGSGMGLSIVKKILQDYGGDIWIDKEKTDGTTIHFQIPIGL